MDVDFPPTGSLPSGRKLQSSQSYNQGASSASTTCVERAQVLGAISAAFPGTGTGRWVGGRAAGLLQAPMWDASASVIGRGLTS